MTIAAISHWIQSTAWATALRESELMYPLIMSAHMASLGIFGGLIAMTDLRLLGLTMLSTPAQEVIARLRVWKRFGFVIMIGCGILLASSKLDSYYPNPYFQIKMLLLGLVGVHAVMFHRSVYGKNAPATGLPAKAAGALSLLLWTGILSMGRWIAYYETPK
ncbi:MAG TPA: DUF6644 family protein [Bryobacteraceae bacterium]|nr:DUF6644 family protein [Bryobacteraceae bacterium]